MRESSFTESQIVQALKQTVDGRKVKDVCRKFGIPKATYYQWTFADLALERLEAL